MMRMQTWEDAQARRAPLIRSTFRGFLTIFFDSPDTRPVSPQGTRLAAPQGFLIEQDPGWVLNTHFHLQHQFQVIVHGSGTMGRQPIETMSIHYAAAETAYGPITAGDDGLWYFSLRAIHDPGSWHMPESRSKMRPGLKKRHMMAPVELTHGDVQDAVDEILPLQDDGLAAWMLRVAPERRLQVPPDESGVGRFYVVGSGEVKVGATELRRLSLLYVSADEPPLTLEAGPNGAQVLALQFPSGTLEAGQP